ncbi:MAG: hypothetical protein R2991_12545 [Thermoanaerobaculia bacterium]
MTHSSPGAEERPLRTLGWMFVLVLAGAPLADYLWETLHQLLALQIDGRRILISIPVALALAGLLMLATKVLRGPEPESATTAGKET